MPSSDKPEEVRVLRANEGHVSLARQAIVTLHGRTAPEDAVIVEFLSDTKCCLLLAVERDRVVGSLIGHLLRHPQRREPQFLLYEIDVRPEFRERGVGRTLVNRFVEEARREGAFEVWVLTNESNDAAMALYASAGFRRGNRDDVMLNFMCTVK